MRLPGLGRKHASTEMEWVRLQRPERSERAAAMRLPHRYRGGLLMLTTCGPRVVMTKALESQLQAGEAVYSCLVPAGVTFTQPNDEPPPEESAVAYGSVLERRVLYRESQFVMPAEDALRSVLAGAPLGESITSVVRAWGLLHDGYVWMTQPDPGPDGPLFDTLLFHLLSSPEDPGAGNAATDNRPLQCFTDLETANAWHARVGVRGVAARVPFVAACVLADRLGHSSHILINPGLDGEWVFERETYLQFPTAVAGYDLGLRRLPAGGLATEWLTPIRAAVAAEPGILGAYAWLMTGPGGPVQPDLVEALGLVLDPALGPDRFDLVRASVRERARALGLPPDHIYASVKLERDDPHTTDRLHVIPLEVSQHAA